MRWVAGALSVGVFLCLVVVAGDARFYVTDNGAKVWEAPSGGWKLGGIGTPAMDVIRWAVENRPADVEKLKAWEVMVAEPGEWLGFGVKFGTVHRVVFTKSTRIILIDKQGKRYASETCLFWPDEWQTQVYDTRKMAVVVTKESVYCRPVDGTACVKAKFGKGSFRLEDIAEFEVVGAVEDTTQRGGGERR